jgi:8-amino-7-oxononanoate synthase
VIQVVLGEPDAAVQAKKVCAAEGVHVGCFRPPSVRPGQAALRLTVRATMTEGDFATASRALAAVRDHVRITA